VGKGSGCQWGLVSIWDDENILELDRENGGPTE
jgi:hypothetical protein